MVTFDLFNKNISSMVVIIVVWLTEMLVKSKASGAIHVVPMGIKSEVGRWFAFSHILIEGAFDTEAQIYTIFAFAVQLMANFEFFPCAVTGEFVGRYHLPTAFVPG